MTEKVLALVFVALLLGVRSPVLAQNLQGQVERHESADDSVIKGSSVQTELNGNANANGAAQDIDQSSKENKSPQEHTQKVLTGGAIGGEATIGCLGAYFRNDGMLAAIYPPSDLNRFGIVPGDKILMVNGKRFPGIRKFQSMCVGFPGTIMNLVILHDGQPQSYQVQRVDSRLLTPFGDGYYKKYADKTVNW